MQRLVIATALILLLFAGGVSAQDNGGSTPQIYPITVDVDNIIPTELTINKGDEIQVIIMAGTRNVVFDNGFESGDLSPGTSVILEFDTLGTYNYQVENEPELSGTLTVVESGAPAPPPSEAEILAGGGVNHFVLIQEFEYIPADIVIAVGDTVVFEHMGTMGHSVDFSDQQGTVLNNGATYNRTFTQEGEYSYQCRFHNAMRGTITVVSQEEFDAQFADEDDFDDEDEFDEEDDTLEEDLVDEIVQEPKAMSQAEVDNKLLLLKSELKEEIKKSAGASADVQQFESQLQGISTSVSSMENTVKSQGTSIETLETGLSSVKQSVTTLENAPQIEIPEPTSPLMMYVSLGLDLFFVLILIVLGVWLIKKGSSPKVSGTMGKVKVTDIKDKGMPPVPVKKGLNGKKEEKKAVKTTPSKPLDTNQAYVKKCRSSGMLDQQIVAEFVKSGWTEEKAKKLVSDNP